MNVHQTTTDDPNSAVLLNEDGLCSYGKIPEGAVGEITDEEIREMNRRITDSPQSMQDLRDTASEILQDLGYGPVQWPIPEEDMERIRDGDIPGGLLLTHLEYSIRPSGIENGAPDA